MSARRSARWFVESDADAAVILVRGLVGAVFFSEGVQKFLFPDALGVGRFVKIGIPWAEAMAPFVGAIEICCGALVVVGLVTRGAAIPLVIDIGVAIVTTKLPMLKDKGFWAMAHEARTDWCMLLGSLFLVAAGSGRVSLDRMLWRKRTGT
jgi:putative oxidoreductase